MPADWSRIARRIRVPMGFVFAGVYLLARPTFVLRRFRPAIPGLWLRGYAAGYVKKNVELTRPTVRLYTQSAFRGRC